MTAKETIEQHRKAGDLIEYCTRVWFNAKKPYDAWNACKEHFTDSEFSEFKKSARAYAEKLYEEQRKNGNSEKWLSELANHIKEAFNWIIEDYLKADFKKRYSEEIPFHREQGDLIDYLWEELEKYNYDSAGLDERSGFFDPELFPIECNIIHPLLAESEQNAIFDFDYLDFDIRKTKLEDINFLDTTGEHFKMLLDLYTSAPDSIENKRFQKLRKRVGNAEAGRKLDFLLKLVPELEEQKKNGDPVWYAVEYIQKNKLDYMMFVTDCKLKGYLKEKDTSALKDGHSFDEKLFAQKYPIEAHIRNTLSESEIEEIYLILDYIFNNNKKCFELAGLLERIDDFFEPEWTYGNKGYKYLRRLSKSKKTSVEYERYLKLREKLGRALCEQLDKKIRVHNIENAVRYGVPSIGALLIIVGIVTCNVSSNKKAEQQRIENEAAGLGRYTNYELEQQEKARAKAEKKLPLLPKMQNCRQNLIKNNDRNRL